MKIKYILVAFLIVFSAAFLTSCSSSEKVVKSPVDNYTRDLDKYKTYSVLLYDMDLEENTFSSDIHKHQYKFILPAKDTTGGKVVRDSLSGWLTVSKETFNKNLDNMGMELLSKNEDGKISKIPSPPGYNNYVGNQRYGSWRTGSNGNSFWAFYGQYAFMSSMFGMMNNRPIYRSSYNDYNRNYRGSKPYYGSTSSTGQRTYGSGSASSQAMNSKSKFKSNVSSKVSRSSTGSYTRSSSSSSRSSRSTGSSSRSRSSSSGGK
ncbi:hypothetical protein Fleli_3586 [Bernardetia litoralis DSM 6794]|uniref:Lipoprotein n=1 Tax=Bernardetia litoralis (strain ATCC 23117 / DSM 6794 / NBRC 15988 / NCIMB 1366 / Fx l1 / Sio-4) TaxID=880071 RepID=I4APL9_BERLS|nr:hypothetical protein [Bernardetia litoralis]AFM05904.1 hypothetical protein Fleli_3586 [Bernardetia litoralis DSM 6794]